MFDRLDLFREDTPTPRPAREDAPRADQARPGAPGQDGPAREDRARDEPRAGHRREHDARERPRRTITERKRDALADVGLYRAVSYTDLSERHFDAHPYAARRAVNHMIRVGLIEEHEATGPEGNTFQSAHGNRTRQRRRRTARRSTPATSPNSGRGPGSSSPPSYPMTRPCIAPRWTSGRASRPRAGASTRVRIDAELKATVATATEKARADGGDRAADEAKRTAAHDLGLHVVNQRPRVVSRRPARHRGRRRTERARERRDGVRPLPRGGDRGEGRSRLCHARQQPIRHPEDRPRAGARKRQPAARAADPRSPAAMDRWSCRDATHRCRRRVDRDDPGAHGAPGRPTRSPTWPRIPASSLSQYWPALTAYGALAVRRHGRSVAIYATARACRASRTSGARWIWWNGRSGAARAAIRSWPGRCSSRNVEILTNDERARGRHRARLENMS